MWPWVGWKATAAASGGGGQLVYAAFASPQPLLGTPQQALAKQIDHVLQQCWVEILAWVPEVIQYCQHATVLS